MDKVNYETYDTDAVYDDMDQNTSAEKVNSLLLRQVIVFFLQFKCRSMLLTERHSRRERRETKEEVGINECVKELI